ncbi:MAG: glutamate synthase subunit beta [Pseudomonadota bacterium]|nr:glutamate synthase subunit beta [Pseudomonadota bacterium]
MGKVTGFLEHNRKDRNYHSVKQRVKAFKEFLIPLDHKDLSIQASRCMDCGIPYCHSGCPVNNIIPDWNDMVYKNDFESALKTLHSTNNFPEFTGRICPAPCEAACTLNIDEEPVTIKTIECAIIDEGWKLGLVKPEKSRKLISKSVAIVGSGPAGLAAAQQLARKGYKVTVYEKNKLIGGLLRYGIPDFKMEKFLIDRRVDQMRKEGVKFITSTEIGSELKMSFLKKNYNAVLITTGSEKARDLDIPGREASGIHFAMDFLPIQNKLVSGEIKEEEQKISAKDKRVVVIGGGDTGSDCIGTSIRQGAKSVTQIEIMPMPPKIENKQLTWPNWPLKLRTSSSQQEGVKRDWSVLTKSFETDSNKVTALNCVKIDNNFKEIQNSNFKLKADLILLAMGFIHPIKKGPIEELKLKLDKKGNIDASNKNYKTSDRKVFAAGDARRGQSLVVWAIKEGRESAEAIHKFLS